MTVAEILILVGLVVVAGLLVVVLLRMRSNGDGAHVERLERELRQELQSSAQATRQELSSHLAQYHNATVQQLDSMRQQMQLHSSSGREEQARALKRFADTLQQTLGNLTESNAQRMLEVRNTLETKIRDLQSDNAKRLEEMRQTVDEKLHATLETRLSESFRQVSERLEKVHQGLGEMQQLAIGVGDLKRVLTNVKTRGTWGEVQLEMLLEQVLTVDQYAKNVETVAGSNARVEFAIKLPGVVDGGAPLWLPIDAKFPKEQYERLLLASDEADADGVARAGAELERAVRGEARTICDKYVSPPQTTDFAILFLPTEGLYAEVMRRPGLDDRGAVDAGGAAQQPADGFPHPGAGKTLVRGVAGAGGGQDRVHQVRRRAGHHQADAGKGGQEHRKRRGAQPPDGAQIEIGGGVAERGGAVDAWAGWPGAGRLIVE